MRSSSARDARLALLTTAGHRDVLEMREGLKPERYNLRMPPPEPLVPRALRFGVVERLKADGTVLDAARPRFARRRRRAAAGSRGRERRGLLSARLSQRPARKGDASSICGASCRMSMSRSRARCCRRSRSMSASRRRWSTPMSARSSKPISPKLEGELAEGRLSRPALHHPFAWRCRADRRGTKARGRDRAVGARRRRRRLQAGRARSSARLTSSPSTWEGRAPTSR